MINKTNLELNTLINIVDNLDGAIWLWDIHLDVRFISKSAQDIHGYSNEDFYQNPSLWKEIVHPDDAKVVEKRTNPSYYLDKVVDEYRIIRPSGEIRWVIDTRTPYIIDGRVKALIGIIHDITIEKEWRIKEKSLLEDLKKKNQDLLKSKQELQDIFNTVHATIFSHDIKSDTIVLSNGIEKIFGFTNENIYNEPLYWKRYLYFADVDKVNNWITEIHSGKSGRCEFRIIRPDGQMRWIEKYATPSLDSSGDLVKITGFVVDITTRKEMEEELNQRRMEHDNLRIEKMNSIGILAGGIAHDFNNILTVILGNLSLAKRKIRSGPADVNSNVMKYLEETERASRQAMNLTKQLLTFAKGGSPILKECSIEETLKESVTFALHGSNIISKYNISDDLQSVEIDEGQINQVIHNITINAVHAMPMGGTIKIDAENVESCEVCSLPLREEGYVKISFEDSGIGIPNEYLSKIFDPYFTTKQQGSGLGLATSYSIIARHGGCITVDSEIGKGTTFSIYLKASNKKESNMLVTPKIEPCGRGRILVMDDQISIREFLKDSLISLGYEVICAKDGIEAVSLFREAEKPFDLVILDLTVPGSMGGRETIEKIKEIDVNVKAIVSSGYNNDPIMSNPELHGFKGVIAKPYSTEELFEVIRKITIGSNLAIPLLIIL